MLTAVSVSPGHGRLEVERQQAEVPAGGLGGEQLLGRVHGVAEQHGDGHGADAARDRRDPPRHLPRCREVHVTRQPPPGLLARICHGKVCKPST